MHSVYWDSDAFLAFFTEDRSRSDVKACRSVMEEGEAGKLKIYTSALTLTEVAWLKPRAKMTPEKEQILKLAFQKPYIVLVNLDRRVGELARTLVWNFSDLKPKDAVHVASALLANARELHTWDNELLALDGKISNLKIKVPGLNAPDLPFDGNLASEKIETFIVDLPEKEVPQL